MTIRLARPSDVEAARAVELAAGARFLEVDLPDVAADEPISAVELSSYLAAGRFWVAVDEHDEVLGYVVVDLVDGLAHIEQVSVAPAHQGKGLGKALVGEAEGWAQGQGLPAVTLTTFNDVSWNRPLYEHLGYRVLTDPEVTPELRSRLYAEAAHGLDPERRVCMRKELRPGASG